MNIYFLFVEFKSYKFFNLIFFIYKMEKLSGSTSYIRNSFIFNWYIIFFKNFSCFILKIQTLIFQIFFNCFRIWIKFLSSTELCKITETFAWFLTNLISIPRRYKNPLFPLRFNKHEVQILKLWFNFPNKKAAYIQI